MPGGTDFVEPFGFDKVAAADEQPTPQEHEEWIVRSKFVDAFEQRVQLDVDFDGALRLEEFHQVERGRKLAVRMSEHGIDHELPPAPALPIFR